MFLVLAVVATMLVDFRADQLLRSFMEEVEGGQKVTSPELIRPIIQVVLQICTTMYVSAIL